MSGRLCGFKTRGVVEANHGKVLRLKGERGACNSPSPGNVKTDSRLEIELNKNGGYLRNT
jgi:hypothetical protein